MEEKNQVEEQKEYKIYLPQTIKSFMGDDVEIVSLDGKKEVTTMKRIIDLCLINCKLDGQISIKDALFGAEIYDIIRNENCPEEAVLNKDTYNWFFDIVDVPITFIFGINAICAKQQLFKDEDPQQIRNKLKDKIKRIENEKPHPNQ